MGQHNDATWHTDSLGQSCQQGNFEIPSRKLKSSETLLNLPAKEIRRKHTQFDNREVGQSVHGKERTVQKIMMASITSDIDGTLWKWTNYFTGE